MTESRRQSRPKSDPGKGEPNALLRQACAELNLPTDQALAWKIYPDRIVILFRNGQKFTRALQP